MKLYLFRFLLFLAIIKFFAEPLRDWLGVYFPFINTNWFSREAVELIICIPIWVGLLSLIEYIMKKISERGKDETQNH